MPWAQHDTVLDMLLGKYTHHSAPCVTVPQRYCWMTVADVPDRLSCVRRHVQTDYVAICARAQA